MFWNISDAVMDLAEEIATTDLWVQTDHTINKGNIRIWTSNGVLDLDYYPANVSAFTYFEKRLLIRAIRHRNHILALGN